MKQYFIIVENIGEPTMFEIPYDTNDSGYNIVRKRDLVDNIPSRLFELMCKRGLYCTFDASLDQVNYNSQVGIHRIVSSLYHSGFEKEIHHIDKDKVNNSIYNLLPIEDKKLHRKLDDLQFSECEKESRIIQAKLKNSYIFRFTLASNEFFAKVIIHLSAQNMPVKDIIQSLKHKIQKTTIYNMYNKFFYANSFKNSPYYGVNKAIVELDGKYSKTWSKIDLYNSL